jgi:hypothetical protein
MVRLDRGSDADHADEKMFVASKADPDLSLYLRRRNSTLSKRSKL